VAATVTGSAVNVLVIITGAASAIDKRVPMRNTNFILVSEWTVSLV
jgi:hypothetical protein